MRNVKILGGLAASIFALSMASTAMAQDYDVTIVLNEEPSTLDPCQMASDHNGRVGLGNIYEGLTGRDVATGEVLPILAASWAEGDNNSWTFNLREGVTYHDGAAVTAESVKFAIDRTLNQNLTCETRTKFFGDDTYTVEVAGEGVIKITTPVRDPILPLKMSNVMIYGSDVPADVSMNLGMRNAPPLVFENGFAYLFGADALGRPILPRLLLGARTTLAIALSVVFLSMIIGSALGIIAGYYGGRLGSFIMRGADLVMSFPSLLLAVIVLYVLKPYVFNVVIVLAITRIPVYVRVARAEVLEVKERLFVESARSMGADDWRILRLHIAPIILPTLLTVASLDLANVMLAESSLSFLGIGVQPPAITWGLMVADGRNYLTSAWWLAFWPGMAILLTALSANLLSNWMRIVMDPKLRWRLEGKKREKSEGDT